MPRKLAITSRRYICLLRYSKLEFGTTEKNQFLFSSSILYENELVINIFCKLALELPSVCISRKGVPSKFASGQLQYHSNYNEICFYLSDVRVWYTERFVVLKMQI